MCYKFSSGGGSLAKFKGNKEEQAFIIYSYIFINLFYFCLFNTIILKLKIQQMIKNRDKLCLLLVVKLF